MQKKISTSFMFSLILLFTCSCSVKALTSKVIFSDGSKVKLEIAESPRERAKGLMHRKSLNKDKGMVFIFKPKQNVTFWMKNTLIPLDIIFIDNGKIMHIAKNTLTNQTETLYPSQQPITEVVEVNAGFTDEHSIDIGDKVEFENVDSIEYSKKSSSFIFR